MKLKLLAVAGICCVGGWANAVHAQDHTMSIVSSAVPMLRMSADARAGGMGDAAIAVSPDASAVFWNRSKLAFAKERSALSVTYAPWMRSAGPHDVFLASMAGYLKFGNDQAVSIGMRYFNMGEVQYADENGQLLQTAKPNEYAIDAGYSRALSKRFAISVALRYIYSGLANNYSVNGYTYKAGHAAAADVTLYYQGLNDKGAGWSAGLTLSNLGSKVSYSNNAIDQDYIPANLGLGAAYTWRLDETSKLTWALDLNKLMVPTPPENTSDSSMKVYRDKGVVSSWFSSFGDAPGGFSEELKEWQVSSGLEYNYDDMIGIRGGYFYENRWKGGRSYATLGVGMKFQWLGANFSYLIPTGKDINNNPIRQSLRASLVFTLAK
ncbi:hypothetical protein SAMN05421788_10157 [Filimonas lacunae]|uniref:Type IX secretion system protein PorV domain-containing protein n=1 Tax=Filimonas lacunae TaxID=477680 RepID=A0A173MLS4_9BACT|nr:type IX secretion system outer membrane channel protein PorV [Filimonas lacunae]BAV08595.1 hypothetical protein FLA_4641 [Filimonas lacunae]SIS58007.1 hypothetical protein SAMN05421788_10157 [Filimonas lacunae]